MQIGQLSKCTGVPVDTIRYYETQGLLPPPMRRPSGYRRYAESDTGRLEFIRRAKDLGFSLREIRELMELSSHASRDMAAVREAALQKVADIDRKLAELQRMRGGLAALVDACPGEGRIGQCPIVGALTGDVP
ncbi:heavy metal-responsive transcriptional regulator [Luteimonas yindakuii]|uniref:heavy metal-responsive transcriptional regulator n=1 Tax=Luteimonas yindakuii TaxID=2565782 RepID=UPI0010A2B253|nr:heavy metal-responsive transcriptional regulator [Luteimonas yindakuii]QCO67723.1 heavy metal-responsive transcriptional regulator [Luteimonas yindakuii]